jgi:tRNA (adenine37-N6)-methyltransferase
MEGPIREDSMDTIVIEPIGMVRCARTEPIDDDWDAVPAQIELADRFGHDALAGLDGFSHVEILYLFHRVPDAEITSSARHPRGRTDWPRVGIFAQRGKGRPNRIGATICRLVSVEGRVLTVVGLDAIDGTPVLDIKPVMKGFLPRGEVREPAWAAEIMSGYW